MRNNAKIGADIAVELTKLRSSRQVASKHSSSSSTESRGPLVVGGSIFDFVVRLKEGEVSLRPLHLLRYTSMAAHIEAPLPPAMDNFLNKNAIFMVTIAPVFLLFNGYWMIDNKAIFDN